LNQLFPFRYETRIAVTQKAASYGNSGQITQITKTAVWKHAKGTMTSAVLLLDDNAIQAATRQTILKRAGYFVIAALNPTRALEQFQKNEFPEEIGLVITDHIMPGMNGAQFVAELRKIRPALPVLVISGLEEAENEYETLNVVFKLKPLLPDLLLQTVHKLLPDA
jgi:CheY-like chemotaxis protein